MPMSKVSTEEWDIAFKRWMDFHDNEPDSGKSFMHFLGITSFYSGVGYPTPSGLTMETHAADKVRMLAGPNHHTILMAHKVKDQQ